MTDDTLIERVDYSPREMTLLREQAFAGTAWQTNETPPRPIELLGSCTVDPDVYVIRLGDDPKWLMACGSTFDGNIIGTDIWVRETALRAQAGEKS